jgi:spore germination cell wall hydrolase CwlJ-like protein
VVLYQKGEIMKININGPYRRKRKLAQELRAYIMIAKIIAITAILLIGIRAINQLDAIMTQQAHIIKTQVNVMNQLMWIRQDINELKNTETEIADLSEVILTSEERDLVERIVASEARGEPIEGIMAVAQVIRDRSQLWGMTVTEVCLAPGQFAAPYQGEINSEVVQAVRAVFDEGMSVFEIPTTHFHADYVSPYWTKSKVSRGSIGAHLFYGE